MKVFNDHRIAAIDIARGYAVLTMFIAHAQPDQASGWAHLLTIASGGERPRTLFAITGGLALGLFVASGLRRGGDIGELRRTIAIRGVFLIALGLFLQTMSSGVSIVLDTWGLLFLIALPFLLVRNTALLVSATVLLVVGTAVKLWVGTSLNLTLAVHTEFLQLLDWFTTGSYPVLIWLAFLGFGYAISRLDLSRRRTQLLLLLGGVVLFSAVVDAVLTTSLPGAPGTFLGDLLEHVSAIGFAVALIAALLLVTSGMGVVARVAGLVLFPLRAVGSMPLTIYTGHVLALTVWRGFGAPGAESWLPFLTLTLCSLVFATLWRLFLGRGPLERLIGVISLPSQSRTQQLPGSLQGAEKVDRTR
ncbi:heparan-alpha-glucosaminide N-acetyltransferase domain-containing protein [Herbiconiux ginsengi]|uniref:Heparan-alpha-glucosaminide N-acetyltransferase catalytic domain-containing protein n=1 Tax=Herbiconiux ginsengi TaxID=381665 RepID=A0A1H3SPW1_9MICO|nr:heparan-alpha-glucosaminide N-acetyltransferase domain-containing protein [Herbiconiux ginsengi]SDZ39708.1 Protein of unknown function [Herbiconiux ginsengi]